MILNDFHSFTVNEDELQNQSVIRISPKARVCDFGQNLKMTKTSQFFSIDQVNRCKSCLQSRLIILSDFHSFRVNEEKLQN